MHYKFCDDHEWVGFEYEVCPECKELWEAMTTTDSVPVGTIHPQKGYPMLCQEHGWHGTNESWFCPQCKTVTGREISQPQLQELPKMNIKTVSIKVQPTRLTGGGVIDVPLCSTTQKATHWSLYLRKEDDSLVWVEDIPASTNSDDAISLLYGRAMVRAAKLSMEHKAYIEDVQ